MKTSHVGCGWETYHRRMSKVQFEAVLWDQQCCWASVRPFWRNGGVAATVEKVGGHPGDGPQRLWTWYHFEKFGYERKERGKLMVRKLVDFLLLFYEKRQNGEGAVEDIRRDGLHSGWSTSGGVGYGWSSRGRIGIRWSDTLFYCKPWPDYGERDSEASLVDPWRNVFPSCQSDGLHDSTNWRLWDYARDPLSL